MTLLQDFLKSFCALSTVYDLFLIFMYECAHGDLQSNLKHVDG